MSANPVALTVAGGGMTRLRVKGAALRNSLYQLTNGYVTQAQTVKVRPGTFRHTNLADESGAEGLTFGLTWFDDSFHVFAAEEVAVPTGYTLHVLNHPAATQTLDPQIISMVAGHNGFAPTVIGYSRTLAYGSVTPTYYTYNGLQYEINAVASGAPTVQFSVGILAASDGSTLPQDAFSQITFTDKSSVVRTFTTASATYSNTPGVLSGWIWTLPAALFTDGDTYALTFGETAVVPVPLKEIHFAQPFMGFLYVVAEFDVSQAPEAAAIGDTFHYWLQTSGEWAANTVYQVGQVISPTVGNGFQYQAVRVSSPNPVWTANTQEALDNIVEPSVPNGYFYTVTTVDGSNPSTGSTEPTWPTSTDATVIENTTTAGNDVVATAAPQPAANAPAPGVGGKYTNPYSGGTL